ncbi:MAG: hypothetical protein K0R66_107 [Gammaproteobacteria bacterium]|jgi:hypothetical protein|nr:hypothetical protein [Gammaproteobacteria bacterium]
MKGSLYLVRQAYLYRENRTRGLIEPEIPIADQRPRHPRVFQAAQAVVQNIAEMGKRRLTNSI